MNDREPKVSGATRQLPSKIVEMGKEDKREKREKRERFNIDN